MLDVTKPVQTRDGRKARIICTDRKATSPNMSIVALIDHYDLELVACRYPDGRCCAHRDSGSDLVNVPVKHVAWFNAYPNSHSPHGGKLYDTEEAAKKWARTITGTKQIRVEWEE